MDVLFYSDNEALVDLLRAALDPADTVQRVTDEGQFNAALESGAAAAIVIDADFIAEAAALCLALRDRTAIPILVLAAGAEADARMALLRARADDALAQPVSPQELAAPACQASPRRARSAVYISLRFHWAGAAHHSGESACRSLPIRATPADGAATAEWWVCEARRIGARPLAHRDAAGAAALSYLAPPPPPRSPRRSSAHRNPAWVRLSSGRWPTPGCMTTAGHKERLS